MTRLAPAPADTNPLACRGERERAVLAALVAHQPRVLGRRELARLAGLANRSERRCDAVLVSLRRLLGEDAIVTVRGRGWRLAPHAVAAALTALEVQPARASRTASRTAPTSASASWPLLDAGDRT